MKLIAHSLKLSKYEIVGLQEVWMESDYEILKDSLPYHHYFRTGVIGSGLVVLSKYPIIEAFHRRFSANGKPQKIMHADFFGGKAVVCCRIAHPAGDVDFFTTHIHAEYNRENDEYLAHRAAQSYELLQFVRLTAKSPLVIVAGDFNMEPQDIGTRLWRDFGTLKDAWIETGGDPEGGMTCDVKSNSYTKPNKIEKRIDYIFYKAQPGIKCTRSSVCFVKKPLKCDLSYTDHYGVEATFVFEETPSKHAVHEWCAGDVTHMKEAQEIVKNGIAIATSQKQSHRLWGLSSLGLWAASLIYGLVGRICMLLLVCVSVIDHADACCQCIDAKLELQNEWYHIC
eukprot:Colp12_sorted_trinity150504_noHs@26771